MPEPRLVHAPTQVEARFDESGAVRLLSFTFERQTWPVTHVGRAWIEDISSTPQHHFLVTAAHSRLFELTLDGRTVQWHVERVWDSPQVA